MSQLFGKKVKLKSGNQVFRILEVIKSSSGISILVVDENGNMMTMDSTSLKLDINSIPELAK